ncbi:hypothetical protein [Polyangium spumosum]|uniref:Uncharacterized protein n=1 Tax=Polyangium spumosum TaxID=889282 RepID=A0A6N7Q257_9BACT|nr:hypothetical protein [Polyangium spumosum]MRG96344.1 hypothetical protein [Polyangium spumosum]
MSRRSRLERPGICLLLGLSLPACIADDYTPPGVEGPDCTSITELVPGQPQDLVDDTGRGRDFVTESPDFSECMAGERRGKELIFGVMPTKSGKLVATVQSDYAHHWLHTWDACPGSDADLLDCSFGSTTEDTDVNQVDEVQAGETYYVVVDGWMGETGTFQLTLELF